MEKGKLIQTKWSEQKKDKKKNLKNTITTKAVGVVIVQAGRAIVLNYGSYLGTDR